MAYTLHLWKLYLSKTAFCFSIGKVTYWKVKGQVCVPMQKNKSYPLNSCKYTWKIAELCDNVNFIMYLWPAFCLPTNSAIGITFNFPAPEVTLNCNHLVLISASEMILQSPLASGVSIRIAPVHDPERNSCSSQHWFLVKVVMFYGSLLFIWLSLQKPDKCIILLDAILVSFKKVYKTEVIIGEYFWKYCRGQPPPPIIYSHPH